MKLLITGICGFVGSTVAQTWLEAFPNLIIYGLDNFSRPGSERNRLKLQELGIKLYHGDIRMASDFESLPQVDWVIDAAATTSVTAGIDGRTSSRQLVENNLLGTLNILEYCKRHSAGLVLLSTSRVYSILPLSKMKVEPDGNSFCPSRTQDFPPGLGLSGVNEMFSTASPVSLYGSTKRASEIIALEYGEAFDFPVWINRCGVLAGAGQFGHGDQGVFSYWIHAWRDRMPLNYIGFAGSGYQVRDALQPRDMVSLLIKQTGGGSSSSERIFNVGGGVNNAISLLELSGWCESRFGAHNVGAKLEERRYDVPWLVMDCSRAKNVLGWEPETPLQKNLEEIALHAEQNPEWLKISGQG